MSVEPTFTAFLGEHRVASGSILAVAQAAAEHPHGPLLIFDDTTGHALDLDMRGGPEAAVDDYMARTGAPDARPPQRAGRGRPRLGVVAREVTLLPRHWDWLSQQPGGASAALRRLVEEARRSAAPADRARATQEALYRVMVALAGDAPGFEDASRALFAHDDAAFDQIVGGWASDVRDYLRRLCEEARSSRVGA